MVYSTFLIVSDELHLHICLEIAVIDVQVSPSQ